MGAEQAFQWAVSHPAFADRIVATSGTAKAWPHGVVRLEGQIAALTHRSGVQRRATNPRRRAKASKAYGMVWLGWLYSQEWWRRELWKTNKPDRTLAQEIESRRRTFFQNNDANDLILQARTWQRHDVGTTPGFNGDTERACDRLPVPVALHAVGDRPLLFRSVTRGSRRNSSRGSRSCRFRRSGVTRPAPAATRSIARFFNENIARFLARSVGCS